MPRVFLSHSRRDVDLAAGIERALRKLGVEAFDVFESVTPGEDWRQSIKEAIRRTDGFVLVVGAPESTSASWAGYELGIAEALARPVLVLLSHNRSVGELLFELSDLPVLSFDPAQPERAAREIVDRLLAAA